MVQLTHRTFIITNLIDGSAAEVKCADQSEALDLAVDRWQICEDSIKIDLVRRTDAFVREGRVYRADSNSDGVVYSVSSNNGGYSRFMPENTPHLYEHAQKVVNGEISHR